MVFESGHFNYTYLRLQSPNTDKPKLYIEPTMQLLRRDL